jgi:hypothetical protein
MGSDFSCWQLLEIEGQVPLGEAGDTIRLYLPFVFFIFSAKLFALIALYTHT